MRAGALNQTARFICLSPGQYSVCFAEVSLCGLHDDALRVEIRSSSSHESGSACFRCCKAQAETTETGPLFFGYSLRPMQL